MTDPFAWPGLRLDGAAPERFTVHAERGVWGKAHGARTDYRWLATTPGFQRFSRRLEYELVVGTEDEPHGGATFWRSLDDAACAVRTHPSRASDASMRSGFLEKQILIWPRDPERPAALAAFALLPLVATLDGEIWWSRRKEVDWNHPEAILPLEETDRPRVEVTAAELAAAIARGIEALAGAVSHEELAAAYARLLADPPRTAWFRQLARPLPPEALSALLLPIPRARGEQISLASWVPSSRAEPEELAANWQVLAEPEGHRFAPRQEPEPETMASEGAKLASALLAGDPELLGALEEWKPELRSPPPAPKKVTERPPSAVADELWPGPFELELPEPLPDAPRLLHVLWDFARRVDRRWLEPDQLRELCGNESLWPFGAGSEEARLLKVWARKVATVRPSWADKEEWIIKSDLLRAAAIAFAPHPTTIEEVGWPLNRHVVPPLLFATTLDSRHHGHLEKGLGAEWGEALSCSVKLCSRPSFQQRMSRWSKNSHHPTGSQGV